MAYEFALSLNEEELKTIKKGGADNNHHMDKKEKTKHGVKSWRHKTITRTIVEVAAETSKGKPGIRPTHWCQLP